MLLGEFDQRLDDKNRVTLPVRLRERFADGVVCSRGFDGCVYGLAAHRLERIRCSAVRTARHVHARGAPDGALPLRRRAARPSSTARGASPCRPRSSGTRTLSKDIVIAGLRDRLEIWDREAWRRQLAEVEGSAESVAERLASSPRPERARPRARPRGRRAARRAPGRRCRRLHLRRRRARRACSPSALDGAARYVAIDRDPTVRPYVDAFARRRTGRRPARARPVRTRACATSSRPARSADAVLMDLGMSSMQVDRPQRGFSYMPRRAARHAHGSASGEHRRRRSSTSWNERELARHLQPLRRGALRAPHRPRDRARSASATPFTRTLQLVATIKRAIPTPSRFGQGHPAKRVFQALRIAVNDELGAARATGSRTRSSCARRAGRVAVIAFHSLEDRMVKQRFAKSAAGCICPPDLPVCGCGRSPEFRLVTARRSRRRGRDRDATRAPASARLRVVQREVRS